MNKIHPSPLQPSYPSPAEAQMAAVKAEEAHAVEVEQKLKAEEQVNPSALKLKNACTQLLNDPLVTMEQLPSKLWKLIEKKNPKIKVKIKAFQKKYPDKIRDLKEKGWQKLKQEYGDGMVQKQEPNGISFEEFRDEATTLQEEIVAMAAKEMQLPQGKWAATGTKGYNSDIDNVFYPEGEATETGRIWIKNLADLGWMHVLGGTTSGTAADLEFYPEHPGATRNSAEHLKNAALDLKQKFSRLELTMSFLEMRRAYGADLEGWEKYKAEMHKQSKDAFSEVHGPSLDTPEPLKEMQQTLNQIFEEVGRFELLNARGVLTRLIIEQTPAKKLSPQTLAAAEAQVNKLSDKEVLEKSDRLKKEHPETYRKAALRYHMPRYLKLSEQIDQHQSTIDTLDNQLSIMANHRNAKEHAETFSKLKHQRDELEVEIATKLAIRTSLFPESYATQAAYNDICATEGGQLSQRRDSRILKMMAFNEQQENVREFMVVSKKPERVATHQESVVSAEENLAKFTAKMHKYHQADHPAKEQQLQLALIDSAKYAERIAAGCVKVLTAIVVKDPTIERLLDRAKETHARSIALEKCKRQQVLNREVALAELTRVLLVPGRVEHVLISDLTEIIAVFQEGGKFYKQELSPQQKYDVALSLLEEKGLISTTLKEGKLTSGNAAIDTVVRGLAGFSRFEDEEVNKLHAKANTATLNSLQLTTEAQILKYEKDLNEITQQTLFLSQFYSIMNKPFPGPQSFLSD